MTRNLAITTLLVALASGTASADTLREALVSTYQANPTLTAQRESLKATDAGVAIARSAGRPTVTGSVGVTRDLTRSGRFDTGLSKGPFVTGGVDISYPLFRGGTVRNSVEAAKTRVQAGRATLRAVEGDVFTEAVAAYMDVIRDRATVELSANNVRVLETNLEATRDRFEIGDVTRTDVAQSEARLELARSQLINTQGRLTASEENYRRVIGVRPDQLQPPPPLPPLPSSADEAVRIALADNPDLIAATRQAEAAGYDVNSARGTRLPSLSAVASGDYARTINGETGGAARSGTATSVGLLGQIPLEEIKSNEVAVRANELALEGVRAENSVGTRTILDVLNAEQELLNSQVLLVTARRDAYVAGFQLLNAMGQAEAEDLNLDGGPLYDPVLNYNRYSGSWSDWDDGPRPVPVSTRTAPPGSNSPVTQPPQ